MNAIVNARIRTLPIEIEKEIEIEIEGEIEILSLFPLGFPPVVQQTETFYDGFLYVVKFLERFNKKL